MPTEPDRLRDTAVGAEAGFGSKRLNWLEFGQGWAHASGNLIDESLVTLYLNGEELVSLMCSPRDLDLLAIGFMANEGLIHQLDEVEISYVSMAGCCVDVWLDHPGEIPGRKVITTGCGGGVTFQDDSVELSALAYKTRLDPHRLPELMNGLHQADGLHAQAGGVHAAGLTDGEKLLAVVEDVGRHNTLDKLRGIYLKRGIDSGGQILLVTGRVSSEMMRKGALMGCPIIASRNSPTALAVEMAQVLNITLVGYVRRRSMRVYTHPQRLGYTPSGPV